MNRRNFFKFSAVSALTATSLDAKAVQDKQIASIVDINLCDGCKDEPVPLCVKACKAKNESVFRCQRSP